jgi:hypothetical protein
MRPEPLIHIGYHKTGSTWLQRRISSDTALGFAQVSPRTKIDRAFIILNPFTFEPADIVERFADVLSQAEHGAVPVISHERLSGKQGTQDAQPIADRLAKASRTAAC